MEITLGARTEETVKIYFKSCQNEAIKKYLPQKAQTVEEALEDYRKTLLPDASSYGRVILADGKYIGDVWCYCINHDDTPNAMISYCIFNSEYWGNGVMTKALKLFLDEIIKKYAFETIGAFTFSENIPSVRVLEKCGFSLMEEIEEDNVFSKYFQYEALRKKETYTELSPLFKSIIDQDRAAVVICNLDHEIVYMNPAAAERYHKRGGIELVGKSLLDCHNSKSNELIEKVLLWFKESADNNIVYTFHNQKENKDVYMVALRDEVGKLIGYYEKHEYRSKETMELYCFD